MAGDDSEQYGDAGPSETNDINDPTDDTPDAAATREKLNQALIQVRCCTAALAWSLSYLFKVLFIWLPRIVLLLLMRDIRLTDGKV